MYLQGTCPGRVRTCKGARGKSLVAEIKRKAGVNPVDGSCIQVQNVANTANP